MEEGYDTHMVDFLWKSVNGQDTSPGLLKSALGKKNIQENNPWLLISKLLKKASDKD